MHIHILGICGTFMGGLAQLALASGHRVSGCDANVYPPISDQLAAAGVRFVEGYDAGQIALAPDVWVIGNVVTRGNPLMEAFLDRGLPFAISEKGRRLWDEVFPQGALKRHWHARDHAAPLLKLLSISQGFTG